MTIVNLRAFLAAAEAQGWVRHIPRPVDPYLEIADRRPRPGRGADVFDAVVGWPGRVVAGLCSRRRYLALALGVAEGDLLPTLVRALRSPVAACPGRQRALPGDRYRGRGPGAVPHSHSLGRGWRPLCHLGVAVVLNPRLGRNLSFHRLMRVGPRAFTARLVEGRGLHTAWRAASGNLPVAVCIGAPLSVQLAASMSPAPAWMRWPSPTPCAPRPSCAPWGLDLHVPAETEIVLEGYLTQELGAEGPFVDLTRTRDFVRQQPYFVVERITHRRDPLYQALLPGGYEHKLLMGMPREPTIFDAVSRVCPCLNVAITPGGGYWLHAVVQIARARPMTGGWPSRPLSRAIRRSSTSSSSTRMWTCSTWKRSSGPSPRAFRPTATWWCFTDQPSSSLDPSARHVPGTSRARPRWAWMPPSTGIRPPAPRTRRTTRSSTMARSTCPAICRPRNPPHEAHRRTDSAHARRRQQGDAVRRAMQIVVTLGRIYEADRLVPVGSVQVAGVSYRNLGDAGLEFLRDWAAQGARVRVPTTLNPAGMDLRDWRRMGISEAFAAKQVEMVAAYASMGIRPTCTCTPYLVGNVPAYGEHIAWSESSAVVFANSVLGARTNREGGPSALAAAICGRTAAYGFHLDAQRRATHRVGVRCPVRAAHEFAALGYLVGQWWATACPTLWPGPGARRPARACTSGSDTPGCAQAAGRGHGLQRRGGALPHRGRHARGAPRGPISSRRPQPL